MNIRTMALCVLCVSSLVLLFEFGVFVRHRLDPASLPDMPLIETAPGKISVTSCIGLLIEIPEKLPEPTRCEFNTDVRIRYKSNQVDLTYADFFALLKRRLRTAKPRGLLPG
jgi:hypothetical protein